jgi:hypothetical protein
VKSAVDPVNLHRVEVHAALPHERLELGSVGGFVRILLVAGIAAGARHDVLHGDAILLHGMRVVGAAAIGVDVREGVVDVAGAAMLVDVRAVGAAAGAGLLRYFAAADSALARPFAVIGMKTGRNRLRNRRVDLLNFRRGEHLLAGESVDREKSEHRENENEKFLHYRYPPNSFFRVHQLYIYWSRANRVVCLLAAQPPSSCHDFCHIRLALSKKNETARIFY